jgi:Right handed beta helix region
MRRRATKFFASLFAATIAIATLSASSASAQDACPPTINACGCAITTPGSYKIGLNINASQGLTPSGSCIEIASSFVILDAGKKSITGAGGNSPTGVGIWVRRGVHTSFIEGRGSLVSGWDVGVLVGGSRLVVDNFATNLNGTAGVELSKAQFIELSNITATSNVNYGIWLQQSPSNHVTNSKTQTNGNIGIYVGCSNLGPISAGCAGVGPSPGNYIFTGNIAANANYGVALDIGAKSTIVTNQTLGGGAHASKNDLFDTNSNCGSNKWFGDDSTATVSQTCIK